MIWLSLKNFIRINPLPYLGLYLFCFNITDKFDRLTPITVSPKLPLEASDTTVLQPMPPTTLDDHDDGNRKRVAIEKVQGV